MSLKKRPDKIIIVFQYRLCLTLETDKANKGSSEHSTGEIDAMLSVVFCLRQGFMVIFWECLSVGMIDYV